MKRLHYSTLGQLYHMFTYNAYLLHLYEPEGASDPLLRYDVTTEIRWVLLLSAFNYIIEHIAGETNY